MDKIKTIIFLLLLIVSFIFAEDSTEAKQKFTSIKNTGIGLSITGLSAGILGIIVMARNPRVREEAGPFIIESNPPERTVGLGVLIGGVNFTLAGLIVYGVGKGKLVQLESANESDTNKISMYLSYNSIGIKIRL